MYDALDNIIIWNDGVNTWNYTYDAENRLVYAQYGANTSTYVYDAIAAASRRP